MKVLGAPRGPGWAAISHVTCEVVPRGLSQRGGAPVRMTAAEDGTQSGQPMVFSQGWEIGDSVVMLDSRSFTDSVESDDPILARCRGVYEVSVAQRTGG
jgi:hypothetical protein